MKMMNKEKKDIVIESLVAVVLEEVNGFDRATSVRKATDEYGSTLWERFNTILSRRGKTGVKLIAEERQHQIDQHGWTTKYDVAAHTDGELAEAAAVYAGFATSIQVPVKNIYTNDAEGRQAVETVEKLGDAVMLIPKTHRWPWGQELYKPTPDDRIRELQKAGALIAAEIDRILEAGQ